MILIEKYKMLVERYKFSSNAKKISFNIGWLFFDKVFRLGVGLVVSVWIARYLGPEQFGTWNYAIALVAIYSAFATLGLDSIVIKRLVNKSSPQGVLLGSAFLLRIFGGLFTVIVSVLTVYLLNGGDHLLLIITLITSFGLVFQSFDVLDYYFQSKVESKYTVYAKNSAFALISIAKIVLILTGAQLIDFVWASLIEIIIGSITMTILYQRAKGQQIRTWKINLQVVKYLLKESWPLILSGVVIMIYMRIDQIMLEKMDGEKSVGIYSAAVRIAEVWYFIPMVITASVYPALIEARKINKEILHKRIQKLYNLLASMSVMLALFVTFFSGYIIHFLYGQAYLGAGPILSLTIWAGIFVFLGVANNQYLIIEGETRILFYRTLIAGCLNVLLNLLLIPKYHGIGAAIATLIAYGEAVFGIVLFKKTRRHTVFLLKSFNPFYWKI